MGDFKIRNDPSELLQKFNQLNSSHSCYAHKFLKLSHCLLIFGNYSVAVILLENIIIAALIFLKFPE
jgi:hypothetical protein